MSEAHPQNPREKYQELGLIERREGRSILVPYESVEIFIPLAQVA